MAQLPRSRRARLSVFVAVMVVVAAVAGIGSVIKESDPIQPIDHPEYAAEKLVPDRAPSGGHPAVTAQESAGLVVIDNQHLNRFDPSEIQPLQSALTAAGFDVEVIDSSDSFDAALARADALVVIDPGVRYQPDEVDRVESFVDNGGRLVMLGEPRQSTLAPGLFGFTIQTLEPRMAPLSTRFGIEFGTGYLFNMETRDGNFQNVFAEPQGDSELTQGIDRAAFYLATHVRATDGTTVLAATDGTRNARGDTPDRYPVAVRSGNVLAVGDASFMARENYNVVDNERLIGNVVRFLAGGDRTRTLLEYPAIVPRDARVTYTKLLLQDAAKQLADDVKRAGSQPPVRLKRGAVDSERVDVLLTTFEYLEEHDVGQTGISVGDGRVAVPGYESRQDGVVIVRAPKQPGGAYDLVVVAESPGGVQEGVDALVHGNIADHAINQRTAVVSTAA